ncbi:class I SAM-dependent methyltransferase [Nonomuraea sp. NPDC050328]|uniref:class I SAM-dependent methyltransferase n=1 Tax=Nonomuraea sp. NPDC050328 TaxID=3364361 RepID=UPI0037928BA7
MTDLFGGAASYYARFRLDHGPEAIELLAGRFGPDARVLDLGCGPGTIAIPLAEHVREVVAVDPDAGMLAEGRERAKDVPTIRWVQGDSSGLREFAPFDHVTMGRSFHWMDRDAVLAELDELLPPGGSVALLAHPPDEPEPAWNAAAARVCDRFGLAWPHMRGSFQDSGLHHPAVLARSPFSRVSTRVFPRTVRFDLAHVVGLQLSLSVSTPARLGDRLPAFVAELEAELLAENPAGVWVEHPRTEVLVAERPTEE